MNLSSIFIKRPIATSLLMVAIFLSGILSYQFLPISSLPQVDYPIIQVSTYYPGASPKVMATSVTAPLERQFGQMPGLNQMTSSSSSGLSLITLQFDLSMSLDIAEQQVQASINAASGYLPKGLSNPPIYSKVNPSDAPIITLCLTSKTSILSRVEDYAETRLIQKLSQISGVGLVSVSGGQRPAVRIQANAKKLASNGLSTTDIRTAVSNANVNAAKGSFDGKNVTYTIDSNDQLKSSQDYADLIISYKNNAPVRLKDVATIIDDVENTYQAAWVNKEPAIIINIQRQPGSNVIEVVDSIKEALPALSAGIPKDIEISILSDRTTSIRASIADVKFELLLSVLLVVFVMFFFLRSITATIIPSIAVPLSLVSTLGIMYLFGFSLNNLTLMALTIATGFVIDDAIVMTENISRYVEMGEKPLDAALKGAKQIGFTIISLTISLVAVLIPLFFMEDIIGRLFKEFAITLAATILISAFISLTLTPMLCAKLLDKNSEEKESELAELLHLLIDRLIAKYSSSLKFILKHQSSTLLVAFFSLFLTGVLFYAIPKGFFPVQDTGMIQAITEASDDTSFENMKNEQQAIAGIILEDPAVESLSSFIGIDGTNTTLNNGRMLINLKDKNSRDLDAKEVIQRIEAKLQSLGRTAYLQPVQDLTIDDRISKSQYQYSITSPDSVEVTKYSRLLIDKLNKSRYLKNIVSDQQDNGIQTYIKVNRDDASRYLISMQNIDDALYDYYGQRQISTIFAERNQYHVVLEGLPSMASGKSSLDNVYVAGLTGNVVPLTSFVKISEQPTKLVITRQNQFPSSTISFDLADSVSLGKAVDEVEKIKASLNIPKHVKTSFQGTALSFANSANNQLWLILAAVIVVYIVLGVLYESYIHPVTILSTLPSACIGALLALILSGKELDVVSMIGIILLIGIVKKNAIMMIDFALDEERTKGNKPIDAIFNACILRFRPIMMTTMAALFGAMPLMFGNSMGSEIRSPLGITIIGGLLASQILTLYTTPVVYLAFDRISKKLSAYKEG